MGRLVDLVNESTGGAEPKDRAAVELALTYAQRIEGAHGPCEECGCRGGGDLTRLGPALLAALEALGLTPRARKAVKAVTVDDKPANPLDELAARRTGLGNPATVDTGAP